MTRNNKVTICLDVMPHSLVDWVHNLGGNVAYIFRADDAQKTGIFTSYKPLTYLAATNQVKTVCQFCQFIFFSLDILIYCIYTLHNSNSAKLQNIRLIHSPDTNF